MACSVQDRSGIRREDEEMQGPLLRDRGQVVEPLARNSESWQFAMDTTFEIHDTILALDRFAGRIRIDDCGNAVFPHFDAQGLSGYELKNSGFTGGGKALWLSQGFPHDDRSVFCESAIDTLSHAFSFPHNRARYASIGGKPNPQQPELIRAAIARMPVHSEIIAAKDAEADGGKLAEVVRRAVELSGRSDLRFTMQEPFGFKDWNDQLRAKPHPLLPYRPEVPSVA